jgi:uncharacterized membrane protein YgdD (TMEM256/DUF423 family)
MSGTSWIRVGAVLGGLSVAFGAFGAHVLKDHLSEKSLEVFETGAKYQMYHALALLAVGLLALHGRSGVMLSVAGWSFLLGTLLFSFSLYALALSGIGKLGMITPFGGVGLIIGWFALAIAAGSSGKAAGLEP